MNDGTTSEDPDDDNLASGRPKREYFSVNVGFANEEVFVRLRREEPSIFTWWYDFISAKSLEHLETIGVLACPDDIQTSLVKDRDNRARTAFNKFDAKSSTAMS